MIQILYSSDPSMARHIAFKSIKKDFPLRDEFNYASFNMATTPLNELADECSFLPLGTERKCIVAGNCAFLSKSRTKYKYLPDDGPDRLLDYCKNPNAFVDLYLLVYSEDIDEKNPIVKAVANTGAVKGIPVPKAEEWEAYASKYLAAKGCPIEPDAARELVRRVDGDYGRFLNDLKKLEAYANGEPVRKKAVEMLITPKVEDDTFAMSNALTRGDVAKAIEIYHDLKAHSVDEIRLINTLAGQFMFMDMVRYLDAKGSPSYEIAKELSTSPKRVEVTLRNLYRIKPDSLPRILEELYFCEKAILTGSETGEFAFTRFLANYKI